MAGHAPSAPQGAGVPQQGWWGQGDGARGRSVALRAFFSPSLSLSLPRAGFFPFSFSFFSFLERSPAPGVWNQLDKLLSYGAGVILLSRATRSRMDAVILWGFRQRHLPFPGLAQGPPSGSLSLTKPLLLTFLSLLCEHP